MFGSGGAFVPPCESDVMNAKLLGRRCAQMPQKISQPSCEQLSQRAHDFKARNETLLANVLFTVFAHAAAAAATQPTTHGTARGSTCQPEQVPPVGLCLKPQTANAEPAREYRLE